MVRLQSHISKWSKHNLSLVLCGSPVYCLDHYGTLTPGRAYGLPGSRSFHCRVGPTPLFFYAPDCVSKVPISSKCASTAGMSGLVEGQDACLPLGVLRLLERSFWGLSFSCMWECKLGDARRDRRVLWVWPGEHPRKQEFNAFSTKNNLLSIIDSLLMTKNVLKYHLALNYMKKVIHLDPVQSVIQHRQIPDHGKQLPHFLLSRGPQKSCS